METFRIHFLTIETGDSWGVLSSGFGYFGFWRWKFENRKSWRWFDQRGSGRSPPPGGGFLQTAHTRGYNVKRAACGSSLHIVDIVYVLAKVKDGHYFAAVPFGPRAPFCRNHGQRALFYNNSCRKLCNAFSFYNSFCRVMRRDQLYKRFIYKFFWHSGFSLHDFHLGILEDHL